MNEDPSPVNSKCSTAMFVYSKVSASMILFLDIFGVALQPSPSQTAKKNMSCLDHPSSLAKNLGPKKHAKYLLRDCLFRYGFWGCLHAFFQSCLDHPWAREISWISNPIRFPSNWHGLVYLFYFTIFNEMYFPPYHEWPSIRQSRNTNQAFRLWRLRFEGCNPNLPSFIAPKSPAPKMLKKPPSSLMVRSQQGDMTQKICGVGSAKALILTTCSTNSVYAMSPEPSSSSTLNKDCLKKSGQKSSEMAGSYRWVMLSINKFSQEGAQICFHLSCWQDAWQAASDWC